MPFLSSYFPTEIERNEMPTGYMRAKTAESPKLNTNKELLKSGAHSGSTKFLEQIISI